MKKSDKSLHNICIAAIKRSTMKPYDFVYTRFYDNNADFAKAHPTLHTEMAQDELVICSTVIDTDNYSVLTTRKLFTKENGTKQTGTLYGATDGGYGDFKGYMKTVFTFGLLKLHDGKELKYFIETGKASMIMIHGVRTLIRTQEMKDIQVLNVTRVWEKQNKKKE